MAKLKQNSGLLKIDINDIEVKSNSRKDFTNIDELAGSIERDGQISPIAVSKNASGTYDLIAGERRLRAHRKLVEQGKPYNQIEAVIKNGDAYILQLTENINRENLTAIELEAALKELIDQGMSKKEVSERLNKRLSWVCDILAADKTRTEAEAAGVDTSNMSSSALSQARGLPPEEIQKISDNGGSVKESTRVKKEYKKAKAPEPPEDQKPQSFWEGQPLFDEIGRKIAVVVFPDGEKATIKEIIS